MLTFKLNGSILEVTETLMSFNRDRVSYWYYNIDTWYTSSTGKKDSKCDRAMTESDIAWVTKYYLPKVVSPKT